MCLSDVRSMLLVKLLYVLTNNEQVCFHGVFLNPVCYILIPSDEDMQSLASLMSMKQADIGNLDDFEEENEEDEENRVNQEEKAAKITGENCLKALFYFIEQVYGFEMLAEL